MAETLFDQGIELMEKQKYNRACPYLEESYRRDPLLGALIALADCEYERGRLATALKWYQEYVGRHDNLADAARQKQGSRLREAKAKVEELTSAVPTIKIMVPAEAKVPILYLDGLRVKPDVAYPVDPGKYEVTLDVFGRETSRVSVETGKGQKKIVAMDLGKAAPESATGPKSVRAGGGSTNADQSYEASWKAGIVLMSLGLIGYVSVYFTAGPIGDTALPGSAISVGLGGALTFTGAYLTTRGPSTDMALRRVSVLPVVGVGRGPERPMYFGVQGRF
jgi:tetratricopeptide (TPR) repeat protein